jgi:predicted acetyltransferase
MDELLIRSFYEMRKRRIPVSTLIPQESWLFGFYEKFGYSSVFDVGKTRVKLPGNFDDSVYTVRLADLNDVDLVASFYAGISGKTDLMIQKTPDDWCAVFEDYFLAGGDVLLAFDRQKIAGICFVVEDKDDVIVKGLLTETEDAKKALLASVAGRCNVRDAILVTSGIDNNSIPLGMARITDVNCMLALFARKYPFLDFSVKVTDDRLFENNATFKIGSGNCVAIDSRNPDFEVPVSLLTRLLFGYKIMELPEKYRIFPSGNPIMNLMME